MTNSEYLIVLAGMVVVYVVAVVSFFVWYTTPDDDAPEELVFIDEGSLEFDYTPRMQFGSGTCIHWATLTNGTEIIMCGDPFE